jgi:type II secretory pathway predicted ATPase ExeA
MIENLQSHWGFTTMPFGSAIPVPALFGSACHKEAVARLRWLISARGLGVLTGEVGSGKTVALRAAADGLDASRHTLIYLPNPQIGVRGIHGAVAVALGQVPRFHHATLIPQVEAALAAEADERNRHVILAIDESHLMSGDQLEAVRMLTSHDLDSRSPLTILLIGQPTLRRRLRVGDMAALDQRIALRYHIPAPALTAAEASGYIRAHLALAGRSDTLFSDDAVRHEALSDRAEVKGLRRLAVAAAG